MPPTIIDIHPHAISDDLERYPLAPLGGTASGWALSRPATWEQLEQGMRQADIAKAALVQASTAYGHDNRYLADCVDANRGQIVGIASVGLTDDDVLAQIDLWVNRRGLSGVRAFITGSTMDRALRLSDPRIEPAWDVLARRRIPVAMNVDDASLPDLQSVLRDFPELTVVLDHAARTSFESGPPYLNNKPVGDLAEFPGVHLKLTTRTLQSALASEGGPSGLLEELIVHFGSRRLAWGSNWPATEGSLVEMADLLRRSVADLDPGDAANICSGTAIALYPELGAAREDRLASAAEEV